MTRLLIPCALLAALLGVSVAGAAGFAGVGSYAFVLEGFFIDARNTGMGGADLVGDGGPQQVLINPAHLVADRAVTATYDHLDYFLGIELETLAIGAAFGPVQVSLASHESRREGEERTAYNPSGTVESWERMTVLGVAGRGGADRYEDGLRWAIGMGLRRYEIKNTGKADGLDAGMSAGWRLNHEGGWTSLEGAVSWQNITGAEVPHGDWELAAPEPIRVGLSAGFGMRPDGWTRDAAAIRGAFTRVVRREEGFDDWSQWGVELTVVQIVSARAGSNGRIFGGTTQWGLGLSLDEEFTGPFRGELHWTQIRIESDYWADGITVLDGWGARLTYEF